MSVDEEAIIEAIGKAIASQAVRDRELDGDFARPRRPDPEWIYTALVNAGYKVVKAP